MADLDVSGDELDGLPLELLDVSVLGEDEQGRDRLDRHGRAERLLALRLQVDDVVLVGSREQLPAKLPKKVSKFQRITDIGSLEQLHFKLGKEQTY